MVSMSAYLTSVFLFLNVLVSTLQYCPNISGDSVPWWIVYQQKDRPFIHYYVDSTNNENITVHFPEKADSVLSRVILSIINTESAEYMVYFNDFLNAKNIADIKQSPMRSQWMHGIFATDNSWKSGTWLLSNNLLFPPTKDSNLVSPESRQWMLSTIGDSAVDMFYVCISADSNQDVQSIFGKILAGNPFIFNQRINENAFMKAYLQDVRPLNSSFSLHASANLFLNCMYATTNETQEHCLFKYSVETGTEITVFTRPRGMIKRSRSFCYNAQSQHVYEFGVLEQASSDNTGKTSNSMFVLTDNMDSPASGITCFGQDISASTETVAIMICVRLPGLYKNIIESSEVSTWTCPQQKQSSSHTTSSARTTSNDNTISSPSVSAVHLSSNRKPSEKTEDVKHEDEEYDPREKQYTKFCDSHDCSMPNENLNIYSKVEKNIQDNPFQKSEKVSKSFDEMVSDIQQKETMKIPTKHKKERKTLKRPNIHLRYSDDETRMNKYLLKTDNAVLGMFCRDGCKHCQKAKNEIKKLGQMLEFSAVDIVIVDINNPYLPDNMAVSWTPFIRYKNHGSSSAWVDYTESDYKLFSIMEFLYTSMTATESGISSQSTTVLQTEDKQSKRKKRDVPTDNLKIPTADSNLLPKQFVCRFNVTVIKSYSCYGNVMLLKPTGKTKGGVSASVKDVKVHYTAIMNNLKCFLEAGEENCISPAVIAAVASRESGAGLLINTKRGNIDIGYGDKGNAYGIMQCDINQNPLKRVGKYCKMYPWDSCEHIKALVKYVLVYNIKFIQRKQKKNPSWSIKTKEQALQGGVAAYNFGVGNVKTWKNLDNGTTQNDYSNDVIARAQWLISQNSRVWDPVNI